MPCFLSHQLFLRKSALLQSGKMIYVVRTGWKPVAKLHFCSFILFILLLLLELFCSYLTVAPYAAMRIRLVQLIIIIMIVMLKKTILAIQRYKTKEHKQQEQQNLCRWGGKQLQMKKHIHIFFCSFHANSSCSIAEVLNFHTKNTLLISYHFNNYLLRDLIPRYRRRGQ